MTEQIEIDGETIKEITLGNTELEVGSDDGTVVVSELDGIDELHISVGPDIKPVALADGSKTIITYRLEEYIDHNGDWEVVE